ncbi:MAG: hypothetical protein EOM28_05405 [Clostridia bacterium]|nr:hypothetical protein [Clostridia bacterium]
MNNSIWELVCFIISVGFIWKFSPVPDANKPLMFNEQVSYQKKFAGYCFSLQELQGYPIS